MRRATLAPIMVALCVTTVPTTTLSQTAEDIIRNHCDLGPPSDSDYSCNQNVQQFHAHASANGPEGYEKRWVEIMCSTYRIQLEAHPTHFQRCINAYYTASDWAHIRRMVQALIRTLTPKPKPDENVRDIQAMLSDCGFKPGPADGLWGQKDHRSRSRFRKGPWRISVQRPHNPLGTGRRQPYRRCRTMPQERTRGE